jgi:hypothetical protein
VPARTNNFGPISQFQRFAIRPPIAIFQLLQLVELRMGNWTPSIVPSDDQTVYLVVDDFGKHGCAWRETGVEDTDLETVITDMLEGQYSSPVRVVGFNTSEGWSPRRIRRGRTGTALSLRSVRARSSREFGSIHRAA